MLLDLSAAFDTIDHKKLIHVLDTQFGVRDEVLQWFRSYLENRSQTVQIGSSFSAPKTLLYGVPQGSVLGPVLFTIYTTPLGRIIRKHGLTFHLYADDTQLYLAFKPSEELSQKETIQRLEDCVKDIKLWMTDNLLKLNDDKTEIIVITSNEKLSTSLNISMNVGGHTISPKVKEEDLPKNLGIVFDSTCSPHLQIKKACTSINYQLYQIGKIRKYLDKSTTERLINASVTSRLDFCNSLLYGANKGEIHKLQLCQNSAARVITLTRKRDHITPDLKQLHWLPVHRRIDYKILLFTFKALKDEAPQYISDLVIRYVPPRDLRSAQRHKLDVTFDWSRVRHGKRSFGVAAPELWNSLPDNIRIDFDSCEKVDTFKNKLKTYLFKCEFD